MSFKENSNFENIPPTESEEIYGWNSMGEAERRMIAAQLGLPANASIEAIGEAFRMSRARELHLSSSASWEEIESKSSEQ